MVIFFKKSNSTEIHKINCLLPTYCSSNIISIFVRTFQEKKVYLKELMYTYILFLIFTQWNNTTKPIYISLLFSSHQTRWSRLLGMFRFTLFFNDCLSLYGRIRIFLNSLHIVVFVLFPVFRQ